MPREKAQKFSLIDNQKELDESFLNSLKAVLYKRVMTYKRNWRALFNEIVLPSLIMVLGFSASILAPTWRSPSRILDPSRLPLPQEILINTETAFNQQTLQLG